MNFLKAFDFISHDLVSWDNGKDTEYQVSGGGVAGVISPLMNNAKQGGRIGNNMVNVSNGNKGNGKVTMWTFSFGVVFFGYM